MTGPVFLDTNVLVYAYDVSSAAKQRVAQNLVRRALQGEVVPATQVLAEFATILLHKLSPRIAAQDVMATLDALAPIKSVTTDADIVRRAVDAHAKYNRHVYDGMIIAAAERARCHTVWSEDFNPGQKYFGIEVRNPFL